jgi:hypothetical protein
MRDFFTDLRRSMHSATSSSTPWMSTADLLEEYDRKIVLNTQLSMGCTGSTRKEALKELNHYRALRIELLNK